MNLELIKKIKEKFIKAFKKEPLLVFSPGRINLIGEHTDYNEGFVFPAAINKGVYIAIQESSLAKSSITAIDREETYEFSIENIKPLKESKWENYVLGVIAEFKKRNIIIPEFNLIFSGDIPIGAGLSSSAALENGVAFGLNEIFNLKFTKEELILISQQAEHNYVGVKCGIMDQYASMFGKQGMAFHLDCRSMESVFYTINLKEFQLLLINSNVKHSLVNSAYNERRSVCEKIVKLLKVKSLRDICKKDLNTLKNKITEEEYQKGLYVLEENERTVQFTKALLDEDVESIGTLLYESHKGLSEQYKVSCDELDFLVKEAKKSKAIIGARMMGGGFGGCIINIIEKNKKEQCVDEITRAYQEQFNHNCSVYEVTLENGTRLI